MIRKLLLHPLLPWVTLFLITASVPLQTGGTNALSRAAAMRAMSHAELNIDRYREWTVDWSLAPDGHYYSNKMPGAAMLGLPVFVPLDLIFGARSETLPPVPLELFLLSFFTQLLPFALLVLLIGGELRKSGVSTHAILFFGLACLFGNTAALYMSSYFGHGMAATLVLGAFYLWLLKDRIAFAGLLLALAAACDVSVAVLLPFFLAGIFLRARNFKSVLIAAAPMLPVLCALLLYNWAAFGDPFALAISFSNPDVIDKIEGRQFLFGTFHSVAALFELLLGPSRGILFTQPWLFAALGVALLPLKDSLRGERTFLGWGFLAMLFLIGNSASWHGGDAIGPRYLSSVFPAFALLLALRWDRCGLSWRQLAWAGLAVALMFRFLSWPFPNNPPLVNLWAYFGGLAISNGGALLCYGGGIVLIVGAMAWQQTQKRKNPEP